MYGTYDFGHLGTTDAKVGQIYYNYLKNKDYSKASTKRIRSTSTHHIEFKTIKDDPITEVADWADPKASLINADSAKHSLWKEIISEYCQKYPDKPYGSVKEYCRSKGISTRSFRRHYASNSDQ